MVQLHTYLVTQHMHANVKTSSILREESMQLHHIKTKMIYSPFDIYCQMHFTRVKEYFCDICLSLCISLNWIVVESYTM